MTAHHHELPDDVRVVARRCLAEADPATKVAMTRNAWKAFRSGALALTDNVSPAPGEVIVGRPSQPRLVAPRDLPKRSTGSEHGRAALVHAVAHIEFNAINLALDIVQRFPALPEAFHRDWLEVADDEARHFTMVCGRLHKFGFDYGDFDAHDGLWQMAEKTAHDLPARLAMVPRVLEARGLDVTPGMIERFEAVDDHATVVLLQTILREEVAHVAKGTRWFHWCCERDDVEPESAFRDLLAHYMGHALRGPFNRAARRAAGFSDSELAWLETAAG